MSEASEQEALFSWIDLHSYRFPILLNIHAIPNGGARSPRTGAMLKATGVRRGVPDIFVAAARHGASGLFIELKVGRNTLSREQQDWQKRLRAEGYKAMLFHDWVEAAQYIEWYLMIRTGTVWAGANRTNIE